ncbi:MAG TPA: class I SAM-dependent methyltransferase [Gemmatimonadaceae bacterium]|nr:class I SAM-dependent methyltransferase [Gemmatimonadaceae bacterium]
MTATRQSPRGLPPWIRAVLALDRAVEAAAGRVAALRDELLLAWVAPERRDSITEALYAIQASYAPGGNTYEQGLFDWEQAALEHAAFPRRGRVLVGGAGGGRELAALRARGFEVVGFDPCEPLVQRGRASLGAEGPLPFLRGSYDDLVRAARGEPSSLAPLLAHAPFDAVILGWGSFSYLGSRDEALALLRALRQLAPAAPVLASFLRPHEEEPSAMRRRVRRLFARLGAPARALPGDAFTPWAGFHRVTALDEIPPLAAQAGYEVLVLRAGWYAHALLRPKDG